MNFFKLTIINYISILNDNESFRVRVKYILLNTNANTNTFFLKNTNTNTNINTLNIKSYFKSYDHILYKIIILIHIPDCIIIN